MCANPAQAMHKAQRRKALRTALCGCSARTRASTASGCRNGRLAQRVKKDGALENGLIKRRQTAAECRSASRRTRRARQNLVHGSALTSCGTVHGARTARRRRRMRAALPHSGRAKKSPPDAAAAPRRTRRARQQLMRERALALVASWCIAVDNFRGGKGFYSEYKFL